MNMERPKSVSNDNKESVHGPEERDEVIEKWEKDFFASLNELQINTESLEKEEVPEEKEDWYKGTLSESYEKAQKRCKAVGLTGLFVGAGAVPGALMTVMFTNFSAETVEPTMHAAAYGGTALAGLAIVASIINFGMAKLDDWRAARATQ